jgi:nitroreductase
MTVRDLMLKNRSYRRFQEDAPVTEAQLRDLVDLTRLAASGGNKQPLRYVVSADPKTNAAIFETLAWAAYLTDWPGPARGERPAAYIVILGDTDVSASFGCDHGIAAQSIMLGAVEQGLGGCMIGSIKREELRAALGIPLRYEILLVLALGKPQETIVIEPVTDGNIKYWRDGREWHHVPKRSLEEIILDIKPVTL